ncbi:ferric reductase-like transmembrane domain-containing protein [Actinocrispum sp. NPDC049592]|uniref:ferric reductase-like transmembrane domain-containing protein n=1 Tax=Actinocrispum sp. NPDC049592 TaxID=3154835 RepID=UPI00343A6064
MVLLLARVLPATILVPLVPMLDDTAQLRERLPNILGAATMLMLLASYAITPLATITGRRGNLVLRRDFALWACFFAFTDLVSAAAMDGVLTGTVGQAGLAAGTLATLLLIPLAVTSNRWSMRRLGRSWKRLHRLIYPIFAVVVVHLVLVGSPGFAVFFAVAVILLAIPRHRRVKRWFVSRRNAAGER